MRFYLDEDLSDIIATMLRRRGYDTLIPDAPASAMLCAPIQIRISPPEYGVVKRGRY